jgi:hypothetical protein
MVDEMGGGGAGYQLMEWSYQSREILSTSGIPANFYKDGKKVDAVP